MNICRILKIVPDGKPWGAAPNGPYYPFYITFADGIAGQANAKTNPPAYKEGDEVGYEVAGATPRGVTKLKIDRKADPATCRNTTPQDSNPELEAQQPTQRPHSANPSHSGARSGGGATHTHTPIHGATVGGALARAVEIWLGVRGSKGTDLPDIQDMEDIERLTRQLVFIQQNVESGAPPVENVPY
jgi:hypothetical protein